MKDLPARDAPHYAAQPMLPCSSVDGEPGTAESTGWHRLDRFDRLALLLMVVVVVVAAIPRLRPGVCFSDTGDLQLASATLGIMHPPGYAGYATLGYIVTRIPGVEPAYLISLAWLAVGVVALMLGVLIQVRLGVSPWIAGAIIMALLIHPRVWTNLVVPEVYMPTLALLLGSAYGLMRYARLGRCRDACIAALLFGFALANRPTALWTLPFFLLAWWVARRRWEPSARRWAWTLVWLIGCGVGPGLYSLGYLWVRDRPSTPYNYIDHKNAEVHVLPDADAGWRAKVQRLYWHTTGREFQQYMNHSWKRAWSRVVWIYKEFFLYEPVRFVIVLVFLGLGAALVWARSWPSFVLLMGLVIGNVVFICTYNIFGQAADLLPLMFTAAIFAGVALSTLFPWPAHAWQRSAAVGLTLVMSMVTLVYTPYRLKRDTADATRFVREVDLATLPRDSVVCSTWHKSTALWYAQHVMTKRLDIDIINTTTEQWIERIEALPDRPAFAVENAPALGRYVVTPYRTITREEGSRTVLWRIERPGA